MKVIEWRTKSHALRRRWVSSIIRPTESCSPVLPYKTIFPNFGLSWTSSCQRFSPLVRISRSGSTKPWANKLREHKSQWRKRSAMLWNSQKKRNCWSSIDCIRFWGHFCWEDSKLRWRKSCHRKLRWSLRLSCRRSRNWSTRVSRRTTSSWLILRGKSPRSPWKTPSCSSEKSVITPICSRAINPTNSMITFSMFPASSSSLIACYQKWSKQVTRSWYLVNSRSSLTSCSSISFTDRSRI